MAFALNERFPAQSVNTAQVVVHEPDGVTGPAARTAFAAPGRPSPTYRTSST